MSPTHPKSTGFFRTLILLTLFMVSTAHVAVASSCHDEKASANQLIIDFNTGAVLDGDLYYDRGESVTVFLVRKNPFKYTYSSTVNVEVVDQTSLITSFLGLFPIGSVLGTFSESAGQQTIDAQNAASSGGPTPTTAVPPACKGEENLLLQKIRNRLKAQIPIAANLELQITAAVGTANRLTAAAQIFSNTANLEVNSIASCQALETAANTARTTLSTLQIGQIPKTSADHLKEVLQIKGILDFLQPSDPACAADRNELWLIASGLEIQAREFAAKAEELQKAKKGFDQLATSIGKTLVQNPFYESRLVQGRGRRPSLATVRVTRKLNQPADSKAEPEKIVEVRFGNPFFSLSAGLGFADVREVDFEKEAGIGIDMEGNTIDMEGNTIQVERLIANNESDPTPLGALQLNANLTRLFKKKDALFALSLGVTVGNNDETSDYGYYLGPSFALLDGSLYFTLGYHLREIEEVGGGFEEGQVITVDLEEIPTRTKTDESFIFVLSYKIR